MIASELISNVVPVLKPEDTCLQALNWMELSGCPSAYGAGKNVSGACR